MFDTVITSGGGNNNGSTRPDFTNYIESAPVSALEALLWLEADRMRTLDFSPEGLKNQQDVVKEEIRTNVTNTPYGGFYWIGIMGLVFGAVCLAVFDFWATRTYWMARYRELKADHDTKLQRDLAVFRQQKLNARVPGLKPPAEGDAPAGDPPP